MVSRYIYGGRETSVLLLDREKRRVISMVSRRASCFVLLWSLVVGSDLSGVRRTVVSAIPLRTVQKDQQDSYESRIDITAQNLLERSQNHRETAKRGDTKVQDNETEHATSTS